MSQPSAHTPVPQQDATRRGVVQVRVRWGADAVLREHHLTLDTPYRVCVEADASDVDPCAEAGALCLATREGGRLRILVPPRGTMVLRREGQALDLAALHALGRVAEDAQGGRRHVLLEPGETAEVHLGAVVHEFSWVELPAPMRPRHPIPSLVVGPLVAVLLLVSAHAASRHRMPPRAGGTELPNLDDRAIAALVEQRRQHPVPPAAHRRVTLSFATPASMGAPASTVPSETPLASALRPTVLATRRSDAGAATESPAATPTERTDEVEAREPTAEERAELEAQQARDRMLRRMRRQVSHLGDCYQELGLAPGDGTPSDPADRARLAECVERRQRLAESQEAGPTTPHGMLEWDVVVESRGGRAVYEGGRLAVPLSR